MRYCHNDEILLPHLSKVSLITSRCRTGYSRVTLLTNNYKVTLMTNNLSFRTVRDFSSSKVVGVEVTERELK